MYFSAFVWSRKNGDAEKASFLKIILRHLFVFASAIIFLLPPFSVHTYAAIRHLPLFTFSQRRFSIAWRHFFASGKTDTGRSWETFLRVSRNFSSFLCILVWIGKWFLWKGKLRTEGILAPICATILRWNLMMTAIFDVVSPFLFSLMSRFTTSGKLP